MERDSSLAPGFDHHHHHQSPSVAIGLRSDTVTRPIDTGDEVVVGRESHAAWHEVGGAAANAGVVVPEGEVLRICVVARDLGLRRSWMARSCETPAPPAAWRGTCRPRLSMMSR